MPATLTAIYCRLSHAPDGSVEKVDRQEAICRQVADRLGWTVDAVLVDNNVSAWRRGVRRQGWEDLLGGIQAGRWRHVVVYHGDRLIRQPFDLEKLLALADAKGVHLASASGTAQLDNPDDRFKLRIEAAVACREVDNTSRRMRTALEAHAHQGRMHNGGRRPYGTHRDGTLHPDEAPVIREVARRLIDGESIGGLARWLNVTGHRTPSGGTWSTTKLRMMLSRPRLAGLREHHGRIVGPGLWEPVLDEDTWHGVQAALARRTAAHAHPKTGGRWLLSGILRCDKCKQGLYVHMAGGSKKYTCRKGCVGIAQQHADRAVQYAVIAYLQAKQISPVDEEDDTGEELARLRAQRTAYLAQFRGSDLLTPAELADLLEPLQQRIGALSSRPALPDFGEDVEAGWWAATFDRRRETIAAVAAWTVAQQGRTGRFDPTRIQPAWRQ